MIRSRINTKINFNFTLFLIKKKKKLYELLKT